jgi:hypothetical protein
MSITGNEELDTSHLLYVIRKEQQKHKLLIEALVKISSFVSCPLKESLPKISEIIDEALQAYKLLEKKD